MSSSRQRSDPSQCVPQPADDGALLVVQLSRTASGPRTGAALCLRQEPLTVQFVFAQAQREPPLRVAIVAGDCRGDLFASEVLVRALRVWQQRRRAGAGLAIEVAVVVSLD